MMIESIRLTHVSAVRAVVPVTFSCYNSEESFVIVDANGQAIAYLVEDEGLRSG
jgi:hypothetical protein